MGHWGGGGGGGGNMVKIVKPRRILSYNWNRNIKFVRCTCTYRGGDLFRTSDIESRVKMAALFGNTSGNSRREPRSLLEFRAGKMELKGTTVSADARKGLAFVKMEDGLLHFCWKDRKSGKIVDVLNLIIW